MQRTLALIIIASSIFLGIAAGSGQRNGINPNANNSPIARSGVTPTAAPTPIAVPSQPAVLQIPKIGVQASVEEVGLDGEGKMGVPQGWENVGWYKYGFIPGQNGSAVIDGHLDDPSGKPAVFWNIRYLQKGDKMLVTDSNNKTYTFIVTDIESYPFNAAPLKQIFYTTGKPELNLITCDGTWDRTTHNYSNRTVVYSEIE